MLSGLCGTVYFIFVIYFILLLFKLVGVYCFSKTIECNRQLWPLFSCFFPIRVCMVERESYLCGECLSLRQFVGSQSILRREIKEYFIEMKDPERKGGRKPEKTA